MNPFFCPKKHMNEQSFYIRQGFKVLDVELEFKPNYLSINRLTFYTIYLQIHHLYHKNYLE